MGNGLARGAHEEDPGSGYVESANAGHAPGWIAAALPAARTEEPGGPRARFQMACGRGLVIASLLVLGGMFLVRELGRMSGSRIA